MNQLPRLLAAALFATIVIAPETCEAQFRPAPKIRDTSNRILESPEFRHLRTRVREIEIPERIPGSRTERGDGAEGPGGAGNGNGGGGAARDAEAAARARARARERERRRERDFGGRGRPDRRNEERRFTRGEASSGDGGGGGLSIGSGGGAVGAFLSGLAWVLVAGVCGLLLYFVLRGLMERDAIDDSAATTSGPLEGEVEQITAPGDHESDVYVGRAKQLAANGRFREAIAQLLLGAMSAVEKEGLLRFRRGLTFRNYATALSRSKPSQKAFRTMVGVYEPLEYGRREQTREHYEAALAAYDDGFRAPLVRRTPRAGDA